MSVCAKRHEKTVPRTAAILLVILALLAGCATMQRLSAPLVSEVGPVAITVTDMDRSVRFYQDVLRFEKVGDARIEGPEYARLFGIPGMTAKVSTLQLGEERIQLIQFMTPRGRPYPADMRSNDRWFQHIAIIVKDMEKAYGVLQKHGVRNASVAPQTLPDWNTNAGGIKAYYFKDPDGNVLEILQFPSDKGDPRWHRPTEHLFLGIDHTAIVVWDTDASLRFYQGALGMRVAGESENYGIEQERLNNVFGARLRITALKARRGPGIELLEYLVPRNGRPYPLDSKANDLWHWHTVVRTASPETALQSVIARKCRLISPDVMAVEDGSLGLSRGFLVRDPDGHALLMAQ